ncbi:hypothetical protein BKI52_13815 [marine bacterium AO1-C]|nr:hypothetical protein BKI52_13815 [marine bacterium AO1-C]
MKKVNVFKGYQLILWAFLSVVLVTTLVLVFIQFQSRVAQEQEQVKTQVQKNISSMNVLLEKANMNLYALRDELEFHLNNPKLSNQNPLIEFLKSDSVQQNYHMDALPDSLQKKLGNVTGIGDLTKLSNHHQRSINAALHINPLLRTSLKNTSGATLSYVIFWNDSLFNLHPFLPSKTFKLTKELIEQNKEIYNEVGPKKNPARKVKWTQIYKDEVGHGLMTTAYIPFFRGHTLEGVLGLDLTLDSLNQVIGSSQRKLGSIFVTTNNQKLLAHPNLVSSTSDSILPAQAAFPVKIQKDVQQGYSQYSSHTFTQLGNYWVYYQNIPETPWKIAYVVNYWDIYMSVFGDIAVNTIFIIVIIFVLLFFTNRYSQRRFISPAMSLVEHIQNEHAEQPAQAYKVPQQWRHWFEVISSIFADNRQLVEELHIHNEELEYKVAKRTKEVTTQNKVLLQNQEEITSQRDYIANQNKQLKRKEKNIQHSLNAALTIQQAVLPSDQKFRDFFEDYFIIFRPKDVVSGDFYWLWQKGPTDMMLMVGDCTGHGIPGAFMSMITSTLLDRITRINKVEDPAGVLSNLHTAIKKVLHQEETNSNTGLEGAIICLKKHTNDYQLTFASARSQAFYITPDRQEIQVLDCDRDFIGGVGQADRIFSNTVVKLPIGSQVYLGSDGYVDQNNVKRKKIGRKRLKELFTKIHSQKLPDQKQHLQCFLEEHMTNTDQRDDIVLIGLKL